MQNKIMNILIVDDAAANRKLLRVQLEAEGHTVLEAGDGVEALAVLDRELVEAIISDILMPNLDGFGLCLAVRKHERFSALPFIFYTSTYTSVADTQLARYVGANQYLTKPAPLAALIAALRDASYQSMPPPPSDDVIVLKQHNVALLKKLEDKSAALAETMQKLERAHERIAALSKKNGELRAAPAQATPPAGVTG
jgi:two-component system cell cycle sensor histidine kinase/response regulator CckA